MAQLIGCRWWQQRRHRCGRSGMPVPSRGTYIEWHATQCARGTAWCSIACTRPAAALRALVEASRLRAEVYTLWHTSPHLHVSPMGLPRLGESPTPCITSSRLSIGEQRLHELQQALVEVKGPAVPYWIPVHPNTAHHTAIVASHTLRDWNV